MEPFISVQNLTKTYASGFQALRKVHLEIRRGEIFALLGPNGAGKTTLIGVICGIVNPTSGVVLADGHEASDELADDIKGFVRGHLSAYAYPRKIEFVDDLPKTLTGKIRRIELRERETAG